MREDRYKAGTANPNLNHAPETVSIHEYDLDLEVSGYFGIENGDWTIDDMDVFHKGDSIHSVFSNEKIMRIEAMAIEERRK